MLFYVTATYTQTLLARCTDIDSLNSMCGLALFFITFTQRKKGGFLCFFCVLLKKNKIHNGIKNKINRSNTATEIKGMVKRIFMYFFILPSILCILFLILHTHTHT